MTTAAGDEMVAVRALQMGVADYVPKDERYVELLPTVLKNAIADHRTAERHAVWSRACAATRDLRRAQSGGH